MKTELVTCNNCGSSKSELAGEGRDHEYPHTSPDKFRMVRCTDCGLMYLNPRPAVSELDTIYPPDYYAYQIVEQRLQQRGGKGSFLRRWMDRRATERFKPFLSSIRGNKPYRILDIGCGDGTILNQMKEAFDGQAETHGIEMNEKAAGIAEAQGHVVTAKRIEECELPRDSFDFIFSFHVIEHVSDPTSFMKEIHGALAPTGRVLIETPNVDTADFRLFGKEHWGPYHFPRHWIMYDAKTFEALAKKTGFEIERITYAPSAIFWIWTAHSWLFSKYPKLADKLFPPVDILLRGSPWIWFLMTFFTIVDMLNLKINGKSSVMKVLMRKTAQ